MGNGIFGDDFALLQRRAAARLAFYFVQGPGGWKAWQDCHERNLFLKQQ